MGFEQSASCGFKCAVNGDAADLVAACRGGDAFLPLRVGQPNGLAVVRGETGVFVHVHVSVFSWKYCKQRYWFLHKLRSEDTVYVTAAPVTHWNRVMSQITNSINNVNTLDNTFK
ncbi:Uncharacterised protein [Neisseria subflava]|nr:Uncharacterised protein [Neisseria subflava]